MCCHSQRQTHVQNYVASWVEAGRAYEIKDISFELLSIFAYNVNVAIAKRHILEVMIIYGTFLEAAIQACWDAIKA